MGEDGESVTASVMPGNHAQADGTAVHGVELVDEGKLIDQEKKIDKNNKMKQTLNPFVQVPF